MSRENKRRDAGPVDDTYDNVFLTKIDRDGKRVEMKVSKVCGSFSSVLSRANLNILEQEFLGLTDRQNRDFRYVP